MISHRLRRLLVVVMTTVGLSSGGVAIAPAATAADGSISGTVTYVGGAPAEDRFALVTKFNAQFSYWETVATGDVTASGSYSVSLPPGTYRVEFNTFHGEVAEYWDNVSDPQAATLVTVGSGQAVTGIDAEIDELPSISGTVTDVEGDPIPGVKVYLHSFSGDWHSGSGQSPYITGADGTYVFDELPMQQYRIQFDGRAAGHTNEYWPDSGTIDDATTIAPGPNENAVRHGTLDRLSIVEGTVTDTTGSPVPGVNVVLAKRYGTTEFFDTVATRTTDAQGDFRMPNLEPGIEYRLRYDAPTSHLDEYWEDAVTAADADLFTLPVDTEVTRDAVLDMAGRIRGHLDGVPAYPATGNAELYRLVNGTWSYYACCGVTSNGNYDFPGLSPGQYRLKLPGSSYYPAEWWQDSATPEGATTIDVAHGDDLVINPHLDLGGIVGGTVTTPGGAPISGVTVRAYRVEEGAGFLVTSVATRSDGTFQLTGLPPDTYRFKFERSGYQTLWNGGAAEFYEAADVPVAGGGAVVPDQDLVMGSAGSMSGQVVDPAGNPVPSQVSLYRYVPSRDDWSSITLHIVGASGQWSSTSLEPGVYRIRVNPDGQNFAEEYWRDAVDFGTADNITVGPGQVRSGITSILDVAGHIKGTVTGPSGNPLSGVTVQAYHQVAGRWRYVTEVATAGNGTYDLGRLRGDGYRVRFRHNGYAGEWYVDAEQPVAATTIDVAAGATVTGINARLAAKGSITGTVTDPGGQPLEDMGVWAYRLDDGEMVFASNTYTDEDGGYTITGLGGGTYGLEFYDPADVWAAEFWDDAYSLETADTFRVDAGQTVSGKNAQLGPQGRIEGRITLPSGAPDGYARAQVFTYEDGALVLAGAADTRADGTYSVTGLHAGSYKVYLFDRLGRGDEWWEDTGLLAAATTVVVPGGGVVGGIDADLDANDTPVVTNQTLPTITGTPQQGQTLTADPGTWTPGTATLTYRWLQDGAPINGATSSTLLLTDTMVGSRISVRVFGAQSGFVTMRATSTVTVPVAPDPANLPASISGQITSLTGLPVSSPTITVLRLVSGAWTVEATTAGDGNGNFTIGRLTSGTKRIRFSRPGYVTEYWQDAATIEAATAVPLTTGQSLSGLDAVVAPVTPPVATASSRPRIQGAEQLGRTLTVLPGTWSPADATLTYQWLRDGAVVAGATSTTYLLAPEDVGHRMSVRETASREHWAPGEATSDQTYVVEGEFFTDTGDPAITGTAQVGQTLTAQPGTWVPAATSFAYQWFSAQAGEIAGATGPTYVIPQSRVNQNLYVLVTGSKPGYRSESRYSGWTGLVTAAPVAPTVPTENTAPPTISGRLQVGARLTATPGVWNNSGLTYTYYWWCGGIRLRSSGPTVGLPADCERQTARVVVGATRAGESEVQASSADTGVIGKGRLDVVEKPKLVGKAIAGRKLRLSLGEIAPRDAKIRVRWRLDGKPLKVFTRSSIKVLTAYVGHTLTARLVVTRAGYTPLVMTTKGKKVT